MNRSVAILVPFILLLVAAGCVNLSGKTYEPAQATETGTVQDAVVDPTVMDANFHDSFETDLSQWTFGTDYTNNTATISTDRVFNGQKSLKLTYVKGGAILNHTFQDTQFGKVSVWFYDDMKPHGTFVGIYNRAEDQVVMLGVKSNTFGNSYYYRAGINKPEAGRSSQISRTIGWHKFELVSTPYGSYGKIDDKSLSWMNNNGPATSINTDMKGFSKIIIAATWSIVGTAYYDAVNVSPIPPPPSGIDIEKHFIEMFAATPVPAFTVHPERQYRAKANRAFALAIVGRYNESESQINWLADTYSAWGKATGSPMTAQSAGVAAWLSWDHLSPTAKQKARGFITQEADYWLTQKIPSNYIGNSKAEDNAWNSVILSLAANMFPNETHKAEWDRKAKAYAFHSFTINETYDDITTQNLWPNYFMDNHNYHPYPHYALVTIVELSKAALYYYKTTGEIPWEMSHNVRNVWDAHQQFINYSNYYWKNSKPADTNGGKDEYYGDVTSHNNAYAYYDLLFNQTRLKDLLAFEYYIRYDYLGNPSHASYLNVRTLEPMYPELRYYMDSVSAKRHAITLMYLDPTIALKPVIDNVSQIVNASYQEPFDSYKSMADLGKVWDVTINAPSKANLSSERAKSGQSLKLTTSRTGSVVVKKTFPSIKGSVSVQFYDTCGSPCTSAGGFGMVIKNSAGKQVMIGVKTSSSPTSSLDYGKNYYYYRTSTGYSVGLPSGAKRTPGWHTFTVMVGPRGAYGIIDGKNMSSLASTATDKAINTDLTSVTSLELFTTWDTGVGSTVYFDDVTIVP